MKSLQTITLENVLKLEFLPYDLREEFIECLRYPKYKPGMEMVKTLYNIENSIDCDPDNLYSIEYDQGDYLKLANLVFERYPRNTNLIFTDEDCKVISPELREKILTENPSAEGLNVRGIEVGLESFEVYTDPQIIEIAEEYPSEMYTVRALYDFQTVIWRNGWFVVDRQ